MTVGVRRRPGGLLEYVREQLAVGMFTGNVMETVNRAGMTARDNSSANDCSRHAGRG